MKQDTLGMSCSSWASTGIPLFPNGRNITAGLQHNPVKAGCYETSEVVINRDGADLVLTLNGEGSDFLLGQGGTLEGIAGCRHHPCLLLFSSLSPVLSLIAPAPSHIFLHTSLVFLLTPQKPAQNSHFHGQPVFSTLSGWPAVLMAISSIS